MVVFCEHSWSLHTNLRETINLCSFFVCRGVPNEVGVEGQRVLELRWIRGPKPDILWVQVMVGCRFVGLRSVLVIFCEHSLSLHANLHNKPTYVTKCVWASFLLGCAPGRLWLVSIPGRSTPTYVTNQPAWPTYVTKAKFAIALGAMGMTMVIESVHHTSSLLNTSLISWQPLWLTLK